MTETADLYLLMVQRAEGSLADAADCIGEFTPDRLLVIAGVQAQLATAEAIRQQTAVFRQLLDEDRAAARDLAEKAGA